MPAAGEQVYVAMFCSARNMPSSSTLFAPIVRLNVRSFLPEPSVTFTNPSAIGSSSEGDAAGETPRELRHRGRDAAIGHVPVLAGGRVERLADRGDAIGAARPG